MPIRAYRGFLLLGTFAHLGWLLISFGACVSPSSPSSAPVELFLSPDGSDTGDCNSKQPCSLAGALAQAHIVNQYVTRNVTFTLKGGTYELAQPFELKGELDSGHLGSELVIRAAEGETPLLSGGTRISGWRKDTTRADLWVADTAAGMKIRQLFINGARAVRARTLDYPAGYVKSAKGYTAPNATLASWGNPDQIEVVSISGPRMFRCGVQSIVTTAITVKPACWDLAQTRFIPSADDGVGPLAWIENAFELLDLPGEWYHDSVANKIYYSPRAGEMMDSAEVIAPTTETLIKLTGTSDEPIHDITLQGLTFSYSAWTGAMNDQGYVGWHGGTYLSGAPATATYESIPGALDLSYAQKVKVEKCQFKQLGSTGVNIGRGSQNNSFVGNVFADISASAIRVGNANFPSEDNERDMTENNTIQNNNITDIARDYYDHAGISVAYARSTTIDHNRLHRLSSWGVHLGPGISADATYASDQKVTNNLVSYGCLKMPSCALLYGQGVQPNSIFEANYAHNQVLSSGGVFLGKGANGFIVRGNAFTATQFWAMLLLNAAPYAKGNVLENNFTDQTDTYCTAAVNMDCVDSSQGNKFTGTVVVPVLGWSAAAITVMSQAGLQDAFVDLIETSSRTEFESYNQGGQSVGYLDTTTPNSGAGYRTDYVDIYPNGNFSNGFACHQVVGEWLRFNVDIFKDGAYQFKYNLGTAVATAKLSIYVDGGLVNTADLPSTGGLQSTAEITGPTINLKKGPHQLYLLAGGASGAAMYADYFSYTLIP